MDKQIWMGKFLILAFIIPIIVYLRTLLPSVGFWDTGEFQTIPYTFDIAHPTGYPTYILLGNIYLKLFQFGSVAWKMNFLSAIFVSLGIYLFSRLLFSITKKFSLSILISLILAFNPYLWSVAIRADPHALHFLFTSTIVYLMNIILTTKKIQFVPLVSLFVGLSTGNHMLSIFFIPALFLIHLFVIKDIIKHKKYTLLVLSLFAFIIGISIYFLLPYISYIKDPLTINYSLASYEGFKRHVFGEDFQGMMHYWLKDNLFDSLKYYLSLLQNSFPVYLWVFAIPALLIRKRTDVKLFIICLAIFVSTLYFSLRYQNASIERYFLPSFLILTLWIGTFLNFVIDKINLKYFQYIPLLFLTFLLVNIVKLNFPIVDASKDFSARNWARETMDEVSQNGAILSWWSYSTPLWYMQKVENYRPDIEIINTGGENWESEAIKRIQIKNVYSISEIQFQDATLEQTQIENLYQIKKVN